MHPYLAKLCEQLRRHLGESESTLAEPTPVVELISEVEPFVVGEPEVTEGDVIIVEGMLWLELVLLWGKHLPWCNR